MQTCFVIQPFDAGRFDKRYQDVFDPAIRAASLDPYRVDRDPNVEVPIDAIERGIKSAAICLADITTDNPNVWYELGYASAIGRPVVMVCSKERTTHLPFDIQHRAVIGYASESTSDFNLLRDSITARLKAQVENRELVQRVADSEQVAPVQGLSQLEMIVLANIAGETGIPGASTSMYKVRNDCERAGLTSIGVSLALRGLDRKRLIESFQDTSFNGDELLATRVTDLGWSWIEGNSQLFLLRKKALKPSPQIAPAQKDDFDDDIPF